MSDAMDPASPPPLLKFTILQSEAVEVEAMYEVIAPSRGAAEATLNKWLRTTQDVPPDAVKAVSRKTRRRERLGMAAVIKTEATHFTSLPEYRPPLATQRPDIIEKPHAKKPIASRVPIGRYPLPVDPEE